MSRSLMVEEVQSLTDAELRQQLESYGIDVGPIMVTTRKVYERKLERLLQNVDGEAMDQGNSSDGDDDSYIVTPQMDSVPGLPDTPIVYPVLNHSPVRQRYPTDTNEPTPRAPVIRDPNSRYVPRAHILPPTRQPTQQEKRGLSLWVKFLIFATIALVIYLVYVNMEMAAQTPEALKAEMPDF